MSYSKAEIRKNLKHIAKKRCEGNTMAIFGVLLIQVALGMVTAALMEMVDIAFGVQTLSDGMSTSLFMDSGQQAVYAMSQFGIEMLMALIQTPLLYGYFKYFLAIANGERMPFTTIFYFFENMKLFLKTYSVTISVFLRSLLAGFIAVILAMVIASSSFVAAIMVGSAFMAYVVLFAAMIPILLISVYLLKYVMTTYYTVIDPELKTSEIVNKSKQSMAGHRWEYLFFMLSYWMPLVLGVFALTILGGAVGALVGMIVLFAGIFALMPRVAVANVLFMQYLDDSTALSALVKGEDVNQTSTNPYTGNTGVYNMHDRYNHGPFIGGEQGHGDNAIEDGNVDDDDNDIEDDNAIDSDDDFDSSDSSDSGFDSGGDDGGFDD